MRRTAGNELNPNCVKQYGSVMAWGMFSSERVDPSEQIIIPANANVYLDLVQESVIYPLPRLRTCKQVYAGNAPWHPAKRVKYSFKKVEGEVIKWTAQSPDLNPIKNL